MAVATETSKIGYAGDGATTALPVPFYFTDSEDLLVTRLLDGVPETTLATVLIEGVDYTVTGAGDEDGGTVTLTSANPDTYTTYIQRVPTLTQEISFRTQGSFNPALHEAGLDKATFQIQYLAQRIADISNFLAEQSFLDLLAEVAADSTTFLATLATLTSGLGNLATVALLKNATVPATSQQQFGAGLVLDQTSPIAPALTSSVLPTGAGAYVALAQWPIKNGGGVNATLYGAATGDIGSLEIALNCLWLGADFVAQTTGTIAVIRLTTTGIQVFTRSGVINTHYALSTFNVASNSSRTLTTLTANAGWTAGSSGNAPRWYKDITGRVHLEGTLTKSGSVLGSSVAVAAGGLAAEARPAVDRYFAFTVFEGTGVSDTGRLIVGADGSLTVLTSDQTSVNINNNATITLDSISFWPG